MVSVALFDLDGTLTDPAVGITSSYRHALAEVGIPVADDEDLTWAIGPPVRDNFEAYGLAADLVEPAINAFRERHTAVGLFEAVVLPGIEDLLDELICRGVRIGLATAKPRPQAITTLEHFGLLSRFDSVSGSRADTHAMPKSEIVADALVRLGQPDPAEVLMVGDRHHDVEAAHANGVTAIGVHWGFAPDGELERAGADHIVSTVDDLAALLRRLTDAPRSRRARDRGVGG